jgi:hypothetical protein
LAAARSVQAAIDPATLRTQNFASDPTCTSGTSSTSACWEAKNNRLLPSSCPTTNQQFGYSATANTSSTAGEIGGHQWASYTRAYYSKVLSDTKTLSDSLSASGTFLIKSGAANWPAWRDLGKGMSQGAPLFGFFNTNSGEWRTRNSLGLRLEEDSGPGRFVVGVEYGTKDYEANGQWLLTPTGNQSDPHLLAGTKYRWNFRYDPSGNNGNGSITLSIDGVGSTTQNLDPGHKTSGADFNRFGMLNRMIEGNDATVYFGDLTINGVPENLAGGPVGWEGDGNGNSFPDCMIDDRHDFGYTAGGNNGGPGVVGPAPANAAGGAFWRTESSLGTSYSAHYADKIPTLTLNDEFYAEGTVRLVRASSDSAINFGFMNSATTTGDLGQDVPHNFVGINTDGPSRAGWYFRPILRTSTGSRQRPSSGPKIFPDATKHTWTMHYVPITGGGGTLTVTFGGQTQRLSISSSVRAEGATLNRFGMRNVTNGGHAQVIYLDDLKYTAPPVLAAPTGLTATAGDQSVGLTWTDTANANNPDLAGYNVYRSTTAGGPYTKVNATPVPKDTTSTINTTSFTDTGLTNGTTYFYVVRAVDKTTPTPNESGPSNEVSATPSMFALAAPTNLTASAGDQSVTLNWTDTANANNADLAGYNVYRSTTAGGPYTKITGTPVPKDTTSTTNTTTYTDNGLTNGTKYYYVVRAVDTASPTPNESAASNEAFATPSTFALAAPTGLTATAGDQSVALEWTDTANATNANLAGYNVYRSTTSGGPYNTKVNSTLVAKGTTSFTDTGPTNGTTYFYVVRAVNTSGTESPDSNQASATPTATTAPAAPRNVKATASKTRITLGWSDNREPDLAGYNVYRTTTSGSGYTKINGSLITKSSYRDEDVTSGTTYYYVVRAQNTSGKESPDSNETSAAMDVPQQGTSQNTNQDTSNKPDSSDGTDTDSSDGTDTDSSDGTDTESTQDTGDQAQLAWVNLCLGFASPTLQRALWSPRPCPSF